MNMEPRIHTAMMIDDEKIDQMIYKRVMARSGLVDNAITFQYADKALEYLMQPDCEPIDALFLDINMPRLNGFEFLDRAIGQLGPNFAKIVVVMLSTSLNPEDTERAQGYDVVKGFLNKPLTVEDVRKVAGLVAGANHAPG